ncbi:YDG/SRA domain-containing protein [Tellurirhabdus rosea]|uniref:YDG/SRA domain-containing protein n=1 Tax=Tellurirhabdus rosea TaxID=2674997 RepID=UPI002257AFAF|nr:YDG/SRA domain-containing protein [Tellurirhabdus rosea]
MSSRIFGHIPGQVEGTCYSHRLELAMSGVHAPTQAGISGSQLEGADSIVLSGGYEDDKDYGDVIIYTGHGGRDLDTGKQITDQLLARQNLALAKNCQTGLPVRVIRGYQHRTPHSPVSGYRYDGLYQVESYWKEKGKSGYAIWRFRLVKLPEQDSAPFSVEEEPGSYGRKKPVRRETTIQRIVRDTEVGRRVKQLYDLRCQVCHERIVTSAGFYAEAAHIRPLGAPHDGPDELSNVLCLCPNHHVQFDFGGFAIDDDFTLLDLEGKLTVHRNHRLDLACIRYHRQHFWE